MPEQEKIETVSPESEEKEDKNSSADSPAVAEKDKLAKEREEAAIKKLQLENDRLQEQIRGLQNDNTARVDYANRVFCMIAVWLAAVFLILLIQGFLSKDGAPVDAWLYWWPPVLAAHLHQTLRFELSENVILALIGGTTASVLGIFTFVAAYLFPRPDSKPK